MSSIHIKQVFSVPQGDLHFYGREGVNFYTKTKTVTTNWKDADDRPGKRAPGLDAVGSS